MSDLPEREKLKPCPFCGGKIATVIRRTCDRTSPHNPADFAYPRVRCLCGAEVPGKDWSDPSTAIYAWNRRAPCHGTGTVIDEGE